MLIFPKSVWLNMSGHVLCQQSQECCGILYGQYRDHGTIVRLASKERNCSLGDRSNTYEIDPQAVLDAASGPRLVGSRLIGFYHSHPDGLTVPSILDHQMAWPDCYYVIVAPQQNASPCISAWRKGRSEWEMTPQRCKVVGDSGWMTDYAPS